MSTVRRRTSKQASRTQGGSVSAKIPASHEDLPRGESRIKLKLLGFHLVLAAFTNTFFQPDEYWQSLEVAHRIVFGYGYLTWEWVHRGRLFFPQITSWVDLTQVGVPEAVGFLSTSPIRSVLHPLLLVPVYALLKLLRLDGSFVLMTVTPRMVQAVLSTVGAWYTYRLAALILPGDRQTPTNTLKSMLFSPYYLYTAVRTFSNTNEASLCSVALFYWFQSQRHTNAIVTRDAVKALVLAAFACLLRPTNAVLWIFLIPRAIVKERQARHAAHLLLLSASIGTASVIIATTLDTTFHRGVPSLPLLSFLLQNVYHSISLFYGSHPWHWYLSQGLPVVLMGSLPLAAIGGASLLTTPTPSQIGRDIVGLICWTLCVYSILGHKEWRFLQPVVPLLHVLAGVAWQETKTETRQRPWLDRLRKYSKRFIYATTVPLSGYLVVFHCIGQGFTLPLYLRNSATHKNQLHSVGFLMPCHSTPWQSHFHLPEMNDKMWFLTCEPPSPAQDIKTYKDESDYFYADPVKYLERLLSSTADAEHLLNRPWTSHEAAVMDAIDAASDVANTTQPFRTWPSHLVHFDALLEQPEYGQQLRQLFEKKGYRVQKRIWNSLFHDDPRRAGRIVVWYNPSLATKERED